MRKLLENIICYLRWQSILLFFSLSAMEQLPIGICYLAQMPLDVQNYIASFLEFSDRENDSEFVSSTEKNIKIVRDYVATMGGQSRNNRHSIVGKTGNTIKVIGQEPKKEVESDITITSKIIRDQNNKEIQTQIFPVPTYSKQVAIANDGITFARIDAKANRTDWATIYRVTRSMNNELSCKLASSFEVMQGACACFFNKQATRLIVYKEIDWIDDDYEMLKQKFRHIIYSLTSLKNLNDYLRKKRVCKTLASSLPKPSLPKQ